MTGSIPQTIEISTSLTGIENSALASITYSHLIHSDLSISHNVLKGTIPNVFVANILRNQRMATTPYSSINGEDETVTRDEWLNLDLSYNKLSGECSTTQAFSTSF